MSPFERWMLARATCLTLVTTLAVLFAHSWPRVLVAGAGVAIAGLCFCALAWGDTGGARRALTCAGLMVGLGFGVLGLTARDPQRSVTRPPPHPRPPVEALNGAAVTLGIHPRALVRSGTDLLAVTDTGLVAFDPTLPGVTPRALPILGDIAAIAADSSHIVVAYSGRREGYASVFDAHTYRRAGTALHYSEASGAVAVGGGAAWLCNVTHAKLDRLDLKTGAFQEIAVPAAPNDVLLVHGAVWVTVQGGWLVRIDPISAQVRSYETTDDPQQLAFAFGTLWVSDPQDRVLVRVDPETGRAVGHPIPVRADTRALAALHGSLFALSGATDTLQQIDPRRGRVMWTTSVSEDPSGLVAYGGSLYVTGEHAGTLVPVVVRSRR